MGKKPLPLPICFLTQASVPRRVHTEEGRVIDLLDVERKLGE